MPRPPDLLEGARANRGGRSWRRVESALEELRSGRPVVVVDDLDRENEGDIFLAAGTVQPAQMAFLLRHTTGIVCVAMSEERCAALGLDLMVDEAGNGEAMGTAFTVTVDARSGTTTGVSAADRAVTARVLAAATTTPGDLVRPGHVFPLRARPGGVLERRGHTEAAVDLAVAAGLPPAVVLAELMNADGAMMRTTDIRQFGREHGVVVLSVEDIVAYRRGGAEPLPSPSPVPAPSVLIPSSDGPLTVSAFRASDGLEHAAVVVGDPTAVPAPLVRVHSECFTGDLLGSLRCDCGDQLRWSLREMQSEGSGALIYLRGHEGRGIGLAAKLKAYILQDTGLDTVEANRAQGLPVDARSYDDAADVLVALGLTRFRLLTNNPDKVTGLRSRGLDVVSVVPLRTTVTIQNAAYLATKRDRMGHDLGGIEPADERRPGWPIRTA